MDLPKGSVSIQLPELVLTVERHHVAEEAPHAMAEQDHLIEVGVGAGRVVFPLGLPKRVAKHRGGDWDRDTRRIHVEHELVAFLDCRIIE